MTILKKVKTSFFRNFSELKKYLSNTIWMVSGKAYFIISSGITSILIARYLKPENFGLISYALSLVAIFSPIVTLGIEQILIREIVKDKEKENKLLGTSFFLQLTGGVVSLLALNLISYIHESSSETRLIIMILSSILIFKSFDVFNYYLQSIAKIKYWSILEGIVFTISMILKLLLIYYQAKVYFFAVAFALEAFLMAIGLIYVYKKILKQNLFLWKIDLSILRKLLRESFPLIVSSVMITIYMKIDQVMIKNILDSSQTGLYAVAVKLSELWYFIPVSLVVATYPSLIKSFENNKRKFGKRFKQMNFSLLALSVVLACFIVFFGEKIIDLLYGKEYIDAVGVFKIYIWATIPVVLGLTSSKWLIINGMQKYSMYSTAVGSITNIILNLLFIPSFGIVGSAFATLISYSVSGFFIYLLFKETRQLFFILISPPSLKISKIKQVG